MKELKTEINRIIAKKTLSTSEHSAVLELAEVNGVVSEENAALLNLLLENIALGTLTLVDDEPIPTETSAPATETHSHVSIERSSLHKFVDDIVADGVMTSAEHEAFMELVHTDGEIDDEESAQISRIFQLIQSGELVVVDEEREAINERRKASNESKH